MLVVMVMRWECKVVIMMQLIRLMSLTSSTIQARQNLLMKIIFETMIKNVDFTLDCQVLKYSRKHLILYHLLLPDVQQH